MLSMEHGVGHVGDTFKVWKMLDEFERRRARVDVYKALGLQKRRRTGADTLLVVVMEVAALIER